MGWSATAASRPGMVLFTQQLVDEIVKELRNQYSLKTERRL
jgi:hypothetical protein